MSKTDIISLHRRSPKKDYPVLDVPLYKLDGSQFTSKDATGYLITRSGAIWTPQGLSFDGVDDFLNAGRSSVFDITGKISLEAVFKVTTFGVITMKGDIGVGAGCTYDIDIAGGKFRFFFNGANAGEVLSSNLAIVAGKYYHGIVTFDPALDTVNIIINGKLDISATNITGTPTSKPSEDLLIGKGLNNSADYGPFNGIISMVAVYKRILSVAEAQNHYLHAKRMMPWL